MRFSDVGTRVFTASLFAFTALSSAAASAAETRSFVVSWFVDANYYDNSTCPDGLNLSSLEFYRRDLLNLGFAKDEVEKMLKDFPGEGGSGQPWLTHIQNRGRIDGKPVNIYANPTSAPDPGLKLAQGKYAYGFNLDGKGAASPNSFEDPNTHEQGVNSEMFRVLGCVKSFKGGVSRPVLPENLWDALRNQTSAWLITITAPNGFDKDGDVTVTLDRSLQKVTRAADGQSLQVDMTYQVDPDPRSHNVVQGHLKGRTITTDPAEVNIVGDHFLVPFFHFTSTKMRFELKPDRTLTGMLGAYQPWYPVWYGQANNYQKEYSSSNDAVGLYYAFRRRADGQPDPKTNENLGISSVYNIDAIPAYVVPAGRKTATR